MIAFIGCQFFSYDSYSKNEIVDLGSRRTQPLYGVAALGDGFSGLVNRAGEVLLGLGWTCGEKIVHRLKTKQESVETLQKSIVQFTRDPGSFADALFQANVELPRQLLFRHRSMHRRCCWP